MKRCVYLKILAGKNKLYSGAHSSKDINITKLHCKLTLSLSLHPDTSGMRAVQAFSILGAGAASMVVVLTILKLCIFKDSTILGKLLAVCAIIGGKLFKDSTILGKLLAVCAIIGGKLFKDYDL